MTDFQKQLETLAKHAPDGIPSLVNSAEDGDILQHMKEEEISPTMLAQIIVNNSSQEELFAMAMKANPKAVVNGLRAQIIAGAKSAAAAQPKPSAAAQPKSAAAAQPKSAAAAQLTSATFAAMAALPASTKSQEQSANSGWQKAGGKRRNRGAHTAPTQEEVLEGMPECPVPGLTFNGYVDLKQPQMPNKTNFGALVLGDKYPKRPIERFLLTCNDEGEPFGSQRYVDNDGNYWYRNSEKSSYLLQISNGKVIDARKCRPSTGEYDIQGVAYVSEDYTIMVDNSEEARQKNLYP